MNPAAMLFTDAHLFCAHGCRLLALVLAGVLFGWLAVCAIARGLAWLERVRRLRRWRKLVRAEEEGLRR